MTKIKSHLVHYYFKCFFYEIILSNKKGFFAEIVLPVIFVCLALLVATLTPKVKDRPPLELHPWYYSSPNQMFVSKSSSLNYDFPNYGYANMSTITSNLNLPPNIDQIERISSTFLRFPGVGTRCMSNHRIVITQQAEDYSRAQGNRTLDCNFNSSLLQAYVEPSADFAAQLRTTNFTYTKISPECDCSSGFPTKPPVAGGDINYRKILSLQTQDVLYDLSGRNVSDWIVKTEFWAQYFKKRFGGFEFLTQPTSNDDQMTNLMLSNFYKFTNNYLTLFGKMLANNSVK